MSHVLGCVPNDFVSLLTFLFYWKVRRNECQSQVQQDPAVLPNDFASSSTSSATILSLRNGNRNRDAAEQQTSFDNSMVQFTICHKVSLEIRRGY